MDRGTIVLGIAGIIGLLVGGYLGMKTEHGLIGIVTVAGAAVGMAIGIYVGRAILTADDS